MKFIYAYKLRLISILLLIICTSYPNPEDDKIYNSSIDAVGYITDRSGSTSSGFFVNQNTVITNTHVSEDLHIRSAYIEMKSGVKLKIKRIIKEYPGIDLAILQTDDNSCCSLVLEDFDMPEKNDIVYSIGNPTDADDHVDYYKMTRGRIEFIGEDDWFYEQETEDTHNAFLIQHTATIKPGNSGGPLLNKDGNVVGVNTFFYDDSLNYAVHVDELLYILRKNSIAYNEPKSKIDVKKKTSDKNVERKTEQISDKHEYFYKKYFYLIVSGVTLYYMFIIFGTLSIFVYLTIKRNKS